MRTFRKIIAVLIAVPIFLFTVWLFLVLLSPVSPAAWITALVLVLFSAGLCYWLYRWMAFGRGPRPGFKESLTRGDSPLGIGLIGASGAGRRRQQERDDEEDLGI